MKIRTTPIQRFSVICLVAMILFAVVFGTLITGFIERNMVTQSKENTAAVFAQEVANHFTADDFLKPIGNIDYNVVSKKMSPLFSGLDIVRIKVWNRKKVVVWSDFKGLVGKHFPDNEDVAEAFRGETVCELTKLTKAEHKFEQNYERLLELYIPIRFEPGGDIENVFEIYKNVDLLYAGINRSKRIIWGSLILGFSLLYMSLFTIMLRASRRIEVQTREITDSESRFRAIFENVVNGILVTTSNNRILMANSSAMELLGLDDGALGKDLHDLIPETDELLSQKCLGNRYRLELETSDGMRRVLGCTNTKALLPDGEGLITIFQDLTAIHHAEERRRRAEQFAYVGDIASRLSHAIKNPLTTVTAGLDSLKEADKLSDEDKCTVKSIIRDIKQVNSMVKNVLDAARSQPFNPKSVNVFPFIGDICESFVHFAGLKNFTLDITPPTDERDIIITVDENAFEIFLGNLILNSIDAIEKGGLITVRCKKLDQKDVVKYFPGFKGSVASISVTDNGHGIPQGMEKTIFKPFYTTKQSGTGLGLSVSQEIIESHGGVLKVSNSTNGGTTLEAFLVEGKDLVRHDSNEGYDCDMDETTLLQSGHACWIVKMEESNGAGLRFPDQCLHCPVFLSSNLGYFYRSHELR